MNVAIIFMLALWPNYGYSLSSIITSAYESCPESNVCVVYPEGCYDSKTCVIIMNSNPLNDSFVAFEVIAEMRNLEWIGVGLSNDSKMADDSVTDCVLRNGIATLEHSWNIDASSPSNRFLNGSVNGIFTQGKQEIVDGKIHCRWIRSIKTTVEGFEFDLKSNKYFVLLAAGVLNNEKTSKEFHQEKRISSSTAANFTSILNKPATNKSINATTIQPTATKPTQKPQSSENYACINVHNAVLIVALLILASISVTNLSFM